MSVATAPEFLCPDAVCNSRLVFLSYRIAQGIYLSFAQQQAIILGDTSGSFIHPFFIEFAHLVGCHFHRRSNPDKNLMQLETTYLFSVLRTLSSMKEEADPVSFAHAHWLVAMACVTTGNPQKAIKFMNEAADSVERNRGLFLSQLPGLSIVPVTASVDYSEDLHERLGLLAHILWFRTYMSIFLVDSGIYPMPDTVPEKIPVCVPLGCYLSLAHSRFSAIGFGEIRGRALRSPWWPPLRSYSPISKLPAGWSHNLFTGSVLTVQPRLHVLSSLRSAHSWPERAPCCSSAKRGN